ncbi:MAG: enoyl-CoA hydratase/isomerase family protein [Candidatus Kapabacteria bacterium]|nr:enoyl-CoA hydratase/isomerase family protein [Ignavibacteriota bacterium]MCW5884601.1 enoyl-CoA hydratase/isomerase family protein [Candidatus Kapabacteria bacterium]
MQNEGYVNLSVQDKVGIITFYHPKSNSLPGDILRKLADTISEASNHNDVNVIVLKSDGEKAFCAGASFDELVEITDFETGKKFFMGFANVINAIRKCPKFVIARVQGKAVGGGVGLAAAADYTFAYQDASIKLSEFALGIGPFVVGPAVERKIGNSAFAQISTDTDWYNSTWALNKGLYSNVFYTIDDLNTAVTQLAVKLSNLSPDATRELKKIFWEGTSDWDKLLESKAEISGRLVLSDFTKNYIKDFKSK